MPTTADQGEVASAAMAQRPQRRVPRRWLRWWLGAVLGAIVAYPVVTVGLISCMPGRSHRGPLAALTADEQAMARELRRDVEVLAVAIGPRGLFNPSSLRAAAAHIETELRQAGYAVERQTYDVRGQACVNLIVERPGAGRADEVLVVGAHYDTVPGSPGANDNASAVAALLALARRFADHEPARTLRFAAFVNEEPPYFQTDDMGSLVYARRCRARGEQIVGMIALETMGYYADEQGTQLYPPPFDLLYPSQGDFIAFVGNLKSRRFVRQVVGMFRRHAAFPSEGAALPELIPQAGWSDHWAFWQMGYPALMVTDTAPFRYPYYHSADDTPDKIDFDRLARVVAGLGRVIADLTAAP